MVGKVLAAGVFPNWIQAWDVVRGDTEVAPAARKGFDLESRLSQPIIVVQYGTIVLGFAIVTVASIAPIDSYLVNASPMSCTLGCGGICTVVWWYYP